jgi:hypothetical protein
MRTVDIEESNGGNIHSAVRTLRLAHLLCGIFGHRVNEIRSHGIISLEDSIRAGSHLVYGGGRRKNGPTKPERRAASRMLPVPTLTSYAIWGSACKAIEGVYARHVCSEF